MPESKKLARMVFLIATAIVAWYGPVPPHGVAETALRVVSVREQPKQAAASQSAPSKKEASPPRTVKAKPIFASGAPTAPPRTKAKPIARVKPNHVTTTTTTTLGTTTVAKARSVAAKPAAEKMASAADTKVAVLQTPRQTTQTEAAEFILQPDSPKQEAVVSIATSVPDPVGQFESVMPAAETQATPAPVVEEHREYVPAPAAAPYVCTCPTCPNCPNQSGATTICGVYCNNCRSAGNATWRDMRRIPWSIFSQGEYVGPARKEHVFQYFLRVDDLIDLVYMQSREKTAVPYVIGVGDTLAIDFTPIDFTDNETGLPQTPDREAIVQSDGTITLPQIGEVAAAGKTITALRDEIDRLYAGQIQNPEITVTPLITNTAVLDVIASVNATGGRGGQSQQVRVSPEGTIQVPGIGSVYIQGFTLEELRRELEARYDAAYGPGLRVTPLLTQRAPSYVFVGGEVTAPGRYTLEGPTTVMQAIALAGGWNVGGNTNQIVVFRRDENWCLKATKIDLFKPLYGKDPCPVNDVWLRDNDLVLIPKRKILVVDDIIELYMTRGVYSAFPINFVYSFTRGSSIVPITAGP